MNPPTREALLIIWMRSRICAAEYSVGSSCTFNCCRFIRTLFIVIGGDVVDVVVDSVFVVEVVVRGDGDGDGDGGGDPGVVSDVGSITAGRSILRILYRDRAASHPTR